MSDDTIIDPELEPFLTDDKVEDIKTEDESALEAKTDIDEEDKKVEAKEDDKEPDESELDDPTTYRRLTYKEITTKYPSLFKDFPALRQGFFREQKFTEIFPTIEDATAASEASDDYNAIVADLQEGKIDNILEVLEGDQLKNAAASFLPSLFEKDKQVYFAITGPLLNNFLIQAYNAAESSGDADLKASAQWLAKWAFGDFAYASGGKVVQPMNNQPSDGKKRLDDERKEYENSKFQDNYNSVVDTGLKALRNDIARGLSDVTSATLKSMIIKAVEEEVSDALERDPSHVRKMDALWKRARGAGFVGDHKTRLLTTYLARAKSLVPAIRSKVKAEVTGQKTSIQSSEATTSTMPSGSQPILKSKAPTDPKKINWRETSDIDLIRGVATTRR